MHFISRTAAHAADVLKASARLLTPSLLKDELQAMATAVLLYPRELAGKLIPAIVDRLASEPDGGSETPFVLVHGYGAAKGHWLPMRVGLGEAGFGNVTALGWEATEDDIPEVAQRLIGYVDEVIASSGAARVHLVGHSMGGVIIRYAIEVLGLGSRVALVAYVAAPHGGSLGAHIGHLTGRRGRASRQCAPGSALLRQVEAAATRNVTADPVWRPIDVISLYSDADAVVTARSAQIRTGSARNVLIQGSGHIGIIMNMRTILTIVTAARIADSPTPDNHARRSA